MGDSGVEPIPAASSDSDIPENELLCTICLSGKFSQECRINGCNHAFCFSCIAEWVCQSIRPTCPMCRIDVDKVLYDFAEQLNGRKEIGIKEFRSGHMSLTPSDRAQLLSERRLVVRNLMHSYKLAGAVSSEITDIEESKEPDEMVKATLTELVTSVTQHIQKAEISLADLRTDGARKNKFTVFASPTFRRIIYSKKVKVKYLDQKKEKLMPADLAKCPDRFRKFVTDFLVSELDFIPFQNQPQLAGHKWRTKFLGGTISDEQKQQYATQIYELMLVSPTGNENFQKELSEILTPVSRFNIKLLGDHLEAIVAIATTEIEDFFNQIYYDSMYNSFSSGLFEFNDIMNARDDPQMRFEAIFSQIHREMNPDWMPYSRFLRQTSNTAGTDRATNNDDNDSDRSDSPTERVPTPMPDARSFARAYLEHMLPEVPDSGPERAHEIVRRYERIHQLRRQHNRHINGEQPIEPFDVDLDLGTRPPPPPQEAESSGTQMRLRSSARRNRETVARDPNGPPPFLPSRSFTQVLEQFRQSVASVRNNPQFSWMGSDSSDDDMSPEEETSGAMWSVPQPSRGRVGRTRTERFLQAAPPEIPLRRSTRHVTRRLQSPYVHTSEIENPHRVSSSSDIVADATSIAGRTRGARRAARETTRSGPPSKRSSNSRR